MFSDFFMKLFQIRPLEKLREIVAMERETAARRIRPIFITEILVLKAGRTGGKGGT